MSGAVVTDEAVEEGGPERVGMVVVVVDTVEVEDDAESDGIAEEECLEEVMAGKHSDWAVGTFQRSGHRRIRSAVEGVVLREDVASGPDLSSFVAHHFAKMVAIQDAVVVSHVWAGTCLEGREERQRARDGGFVAQMDVVAYAVDNVVEGVALGAVAAPRLGEGTSLHRRRRNHHRFCRDSLLGPCVHVVGHTVRSR